MVRFSYAMSLGADCEVSTRLKQFNLWKLRSLFDDIGMPLPDIIDLIDNKLMDFARLENLEVKKDLFELVIHRKHKELRVVDKKYNAELWHYFSYGLPIEEQYEKASLRIKVLTERFLKEIQTPEPVLFIRKQSMLESLFLPEDVKNQYRKLYQCLKTVRLDKPFKVLALGKQDVFSQQWGIEGIESRQLIYRGINPFIWEKEAFIDPVWYELVEIVNSYKIL